MPETFYGLLAEHYIRVLGVLYLFGNCEPFFLYVPIIPSINLLRNEEAKNAQLYKRQLSTVSVMTVSLLVTIPCVNNCSTVSKYSTVQYILYYCIMGVI